MALTGDDCRFFMNNECVRGNSCSFRHQPGARETEAICPDWIKGTCIKTTCVLRHMIDPGRARVPCYWESQPNGCLKASCPFLHTKTKAAITIQPSVANVVVPASNHTIIDHVQPRLESTPLPNIVPKIEKHFPHAVIHNGNISMQSTKMIPSQYHQIIGPSLGPQIQLQNQRFVIQQPVVRAGVNVYPQNGAPSQNSVPGPTVASFPKNEHFSRQVELFKKMLAKKNNSTIEDGDDGSDEYESSGRYKRKERHKRKNKKHKEVHHHSASKKSSSKKEKSVVRKSDEEILYGDFKEIPLEKSSKRLSDNSDVNVKPYEEILREKALRKVMAKRKAKFNDDFEEILGGKRKASKSAEDDSSLVDITIDEHFSKEDAVELDASPIRHDDDFSSPATPVKMRSDVKKENDDDTHEILDDDDDLSEQVISGNENKPQEIDDDEHFEKSDEGKVVEVISDETIDFGVDASDDLAVELRSMNSTNSSKLSKHNRKLKSSVVVTKSHISKKKVHDSQEKRKVRVSDTKLDGMEKTKKHSSSKTLEKKSNSKANVVVIGSPKRPNELPTTSEISKVKVKSFQEIMAEKRLRNASKTHTTSTKADDLKEKSKQVRNNLLGEEEEKSKQLKSVARKNLVKRQNSEESKNKRKAIELYKPPFNPEGKTEMIETKTVVDTGPRKIIRIKKSIPPVNSSGRRLSASDADNSSKDESKNTVKSFEEIMREKKLRKQKLTQQPTANNEQVNGDKTNGGEKLVRHRFLKKDVIVKSSVAAISSDVALAKKPKMKVRPMPISKAKSQSESESKPVSETNIARVPPMHTENLVSEPMKQDAVPATSTQSFCVNGEASNEPTFVEEPPRDEVVLTNTIENIQEALDEKKRIREKEILSDEEFEKEINDLCDDELSDGGGEIDDDDLMMEIEQMIDS